MKSSIIAAVLTAVTFAAPIALAQGTKTVATKAECEKLKDMRWDAKADAGKGACVKK